jgi:hypothetical protein
MLYIDTCQFLKGIFVVYIKNNSSTFMLFFVFKYGIEFDILKTNTLLCAHYLF